MDIEAFLLRMNQLDDSVIWHIATLAAGVAGERAQQRGHDEIEKACVEFVETMAECAGTANMVYQLDA
jgi:hypothetical protein